MSSYKKTYSPCDDCQYSYSKNGQEMDTCNICEYKHLQDSWENRTDKIIEELKEYSFGDPYGHELVDIRDAIEIVKKGGGNDYQTNPMKAVKTTSLPVKSY